MAPTLYILRWIKYNRKGIRRIYKRKYAWHMIWYDQLNCTSIWRLAIETGGWAEFSISPSTTTHNCMVIGHYIIELTSNNSRQ